MDQIAQIDSELTRSRIIAFVAETFNQVQLRGPSGAPWQQVELAVYLTYIYGELQKSCAFFQRSIIIDRHGSLQGG